MPVAQRTAMSTQCLQPRTANISSAAAGLRNGFGLRNSPSTAAALSVNKRLRSRCRCTPGEPFYEACQRSEFQDRADRATAGALDHSVPATPGATHRATVPGNGAPLGARPQAEKGKPRHLPAEVMRKQSDSLSHGRRGRVMRPFCQNRCALVCVLLSARQSRRSGQLRGHSAPLTKGDQA